MLLHFAKRASAIIGASLFLFCSCADYFFEDFTVKDSYLSQEKAWVEFSAPINASSAKENFFFAKEETRLEGKISLSGNFLMFEPYEKIEEKRSYTIKVFAGARDEKGKCLQYDYSKTIHLKNDLTRPQALSVKTTDCGIEIQFNKEMNEESFLENFSIQPQKDFFVKWNKGHDIVQLDFKGALLEKTLYSIKIQGDIKDSFNNKMQNDFYWSWTNESQAKSLETTFYGRRAGQTDEIPLFDSFEEMDFDKGIEIRFNKKIESKNLLGAISLEPQVSFEIIPRLGEKGDLCSEALLKFNSKPKWGQELLLIVEEKILDDNGSKMKAKRIALKNNAEEFRPPKVEFIAFKSGQKAFVLSEENNFLNATFELSEYPEGEEKDFPLFFVCSISEKSKVLDRISAMEAASVQGNACAAIKLKTMECLSKNETALENDFLAQKEFREALEKLESEGKNFSLIKCKGSFKNFQRNGKPARGLIEFVVSEKLCDDKKNFLEESARLTCDKN